MKIKFAAILDFNVAKVAVESDGDALRYVPDTIEGYAEVAKVAVGRNGYALQYVLSRNLFISIAASMNIEIYIEDNEPA